jgi:Glycosyltransferase Family 4
VNILIVASKEPLPARDGGRLCTQQLIAGLCELGHQVTVIAPCFGKLADAKALATAAGYSYQGMVSPLRPWPWVALRALCSRQSLSITRHHHPAIEQAVAAHLQEQVCELIIVEQLQALSHIGTVNCPVLLRMHNVESALWSQSALGSPWFHPKHYLLKLEARRLQRAEIKAVNHCDALTTLTREDALHWQTHPLRERITAVAPGFTANLPAGKALPGSPALALAGSAGWQPNQAANAWFIKCVWPVIKATIPAAQLETVRSATRLLPTTPHLPTHKALFRKAPSRWCPCTPARVSACGFWKLGRVACPWWRAIRRPLGFGQMRRFCWRIAQKSGLLRSKKFIHKRLIMLTL